MKKARLMELMDRAEGVCVAGKQVDDERLVAVGELYEGRIQRELRRSGMHRTGLRRGYLLKSGRLMDWVNARQKRVMTVAEEVKTLYNSVRETDE